MPCFAGEAKALAMRCGRWVRGYAAGGCADTRLTLTVAVLDEGLLKTLLTVLDEGLLKTLD